MFYARECDALKNGACLKEYRGQLNLFLHGLYRDNEEFFRLKLALTVLALRWVETGEILSELGKGDDGKGADHLLDQGLFWDDNISTLDCACFYDRAEFRRSAHFAWGKCAVRIQGLDGRSRFLSDLWKLFVDGGEIDLSVNYGFTTKRNFARSMKIQELSYENIPVIEKKKERAPRISLRPAEETDHLRQGRQGNFRRGRVGCEPRRREIFKNAARRSGKFFKRPYYTWALYARLRGRICIKLQRIRLCIDGV